MRRLARKTILITGSTSGIGAAIARRCAEEGATVAVHGISDLEGRQVAEETGGAYFRADLSVPSECERLIGAAEDRFGRLDGLVNNAAVVPRASLEGTTPELFDRTMAVNVRAPLLLIQAAAPFFRKVGGGVVLNVGSVNAYCGESELLAYSVSKGALTTMTRNLADALASDRIRLNQLNIGWVLTEREQRDMVARGHREDWHRHLPIQLAPAGRPYLPEEIAAHAVSFLADEGGFVSGSVMDIQQFPLLGRNPRKTVALLNE